ncbi:hypothetical protein ACFY8B_32885 [Streptomyces sp. NPDC012751]|uniref:hypothetical protein n=1 Tax=Streptomyces sp. NPDC012751 TaxID=3364846 RepID=UPI0036A48A22
MSGEPGVSRLDALRFARRVVAEQTIRQPAHSDRWIADEERREAEHQRAKRVGRPPRTG